MSERPINPSVPEPSEDREQLLQRLQTAERERDAVRKRRRYLAWCLVGMVLLFVAAAGGAAWLLREQQAAADARRRQADGETALVLERARALLVAGRQAQDRDKLAEAKAEADRAVDIAHSGGASEAVQEEAITFQAEAKEQMVRAREEAKAREARAERDRVLLRDLLDVAAPREVRAYIRDDRGAMLALAEPSVDEQYAAAFRRWGNLDVDAGSEAAVAARLREEPEAVVQEVVAALDNWMLHRRWQKQPEAKWRRLVRLADQLDRDPRSRQLRALLAGEAPPPRAEAVAGLAGAWPPWPALWQLARGEKWRRLRALQQQIDPAAPVRTVVLLALASEQVGDAAGAEKLLRRAVAARPESMVLLDTLGKVLERQGPSRLAEAVECYRAARALRPSLGVALARVLNKAGRAAEGEAVVRDLIRQQPNNPELHAYLGHALAEQKKPDEAAAAFRKAIDLRPDYTEAYSNLGVVLLEQKKAGDAVAAFRKAIDLKPDYAEAYLGLGAALHDQGKLEEAIASYRKALALDPNLTAAQTNLDRALKGEGPK